MTESTTGLKTRPTAILLDLGDTLIHGNFTAGATQAVWEEVYQQIINPANDPALPSLPVVRQAITENVGKAMAHTWQHKTEEELDIISLFSKAFATAGLQNWNDIAFIEQVITAEQGLLYKRIVEVGPTVEATLTALRKQGYVLAMVSNFCNIPAVVRQNLTELGLLQHFDEIIISCEIGWRKPSTQIYATVCEKLKLAPAQCLFVGDRIIEDIIGPQRAGMQAVLTHEFRQEEFDASTQPTAVIKRLDELLKVLSFEF